MSAACDPLKKKFITKSNQVRTFAQQTCLHGDLEGACVLLAALQTFMFYVFMQSKEN